MNVRGTRRLWAAPLGIVIALVFALGVACGGGSTPTPTTSPTSSATNTPAPGTPIKIGSLLPSTGAFVFEGTNGNEALKLFWDQHNNEVAGHPVQLLYEDTAADPNTALTKARKLVEQDHVNILIGPVGSNQSLAIRDYVTQQKMPTVLGYSIAKELTQDQGSDYIYRVTGSLQINRPGGWYLASQMGLKKAIIVSQDYAAGHDAADQFMELYQNAGGQVVDQIYIPLGATDVSSYLAKIKSETSKADVLAPVFLVGQTAIQFMKGLEDYGIKGDLPVYTSGVLVDPGSTLPQIGDTAVGDTYFADWGMTLDNPENKAFIQAWQSTYNKTPSQHSVYGYIEAEVIYQALEKVNGDMSNTQAFLDALQSVQMNTPRGPFKFDAKHQVITPVYIEKVTKQSDGTLSSDILDTVNNVDQFWQPTS